MDARYVDEEITLVRYYPNYKVALLWYQDAGLCKQVDNKEEIYDLLRLKRMYQYLDRNGKLFYIKYKNRLCGDVCLKQDGEVCIVVAKAFQNKHIGRRVIGEVIALAREMDFDKIYAEIYDFNHQSKKMFESMGFQKTDAQMYIRKL